MNAKQTHIVVNRLSEKDKGIQGITFLRECIEALNQRPETLNENKSALELLKDYLLSGKQP